MKEQEAPRDPVVENRRAQLRAWIDHFFAGSQAAFGASTANAALGERQINQGELSGLLKSKSFGEKRARSLEAQAQMPVGYLDSTSPPNSPTLTPFLHVREPIGTKDTAFAPPVRWPFTLVSYKRFLALREKLGAKLAGEAVNEMDKHLDIMVARWEREAQTTKKSSAGR